MNKVKNIFKIIKDNLAFVIMLSVVVTVTIMTGINTFAATIDTAYYRSFLAADRDLYGEKYAPAHKLSSGDIDLSTGEVSINEIDVSLPGKNGLDLNIHRIYSSQETKQQMEFEVYTGGLDIDIEKAYRYTVMDGSGRQILVSFESEEEMLDTIQTTEDRLSKNMREDAYGIAYHKYSSIRATDGTILLERDKTREAVPIATTGKSGITTAGKSEGNIKLATDNREWKIAMPYVACFGDDFDDNRKYFYYRFGNEKGEVYNLRFYVARNTNTSDPLGTVYSMRFFGKAYSMDVTYDAESGTHTLILTDKEGKTYTFNLGNIIKSSSTVRKVTVADRYGNKIEYDQSSITDSYGRKLMVGSSGIQILKDGSYRYLVKYGVEEIYDQERDPYGMLTIFTKTKLTVSRNTAQLDDIQDVFENTIYITQAKETDAVGANYERVPVSLLKEVIYDEGLKYVYEYETKCTEEKEPINANYYETKRFYKVPKVISKTEQMLSGSGYGEKSKRAFNYIKNTGLYVYSECDKVNETFTYGGNRPVYIEYNYDFVDRLLSKKEEMGSHIRTTEYMQRQDSAIHQIRYIDETDYSYYRQMPVAGIAVIEDDVVVDTQYMEYTRDRKPTLVQKGFQKETYVYDETYGFVTEYTKTTDDGKQLKVVNTKTEDGKSIAKTDTYEIAGDGTTLVNTTTFTYNSDGTVAGETTDDGGTTIYTYDYSLFDDSPNGKHSITASLETSDLNGAARTESTSTEYDFLGNVSKITDGNGNSTTYRYDMLGRLLEERYADGTSRKVEYNDVENIVTATEPDGRKIAYKYNPKDSLIKVYLPDQNNQPLQVNTYDNLERITQKTVYLDSGKTTSEQYQYDDLGQIIEKINSSTGMATKITNFAYEKTNTRVAFTHNGTTYFELNGEYEKGLLLINPTTNYDVSWKSYAEVLVDGVSAAYLPGCFDDVEAKEFDVSNAQELRLTGKMTGSVYVILTKKGEAGAGSLSAKTTVTASYSGGNYFRLPNDIIKYDADGNIISAELVDNTTSEVLNRDEYEYDYLGNVTEHRDSSVTMLNNGTYTSRKEYNIQGLPVKETNALGDSKLYTYDSQGRLLTAQDEMGGVTRYSYDVLGRALSAETDINDSETARTEKFYDSNGNIVKERVKNNKVGESASYKEVFYEYDNMNRLTATKVNDGTRDIYTQYAYDSLGNITMQVTGQTEKLDLSDALPDNVNVTYYEYDRFGNVTKTTDANGRCETATYNLVGWPTSTTDKKGVTTTYTYNAYGSPLKVTTQGMKPINYSHNINNLLVQSRQGENTTTYSYDLRGRLTKETENDIVKTYQTDILGNVTYAEISGIGTTYTYDNLNRLTSATFDGGSASYTYDKAGRLVGETKGDISTTYTYNNAGWLTSKTNTNTANGQTTTYALTYYSDGNIASRTENGATTNYTYDNLGQLVKENNTSYEYDTRGNRIKKTQGEVVTDYRYDRTNKLLTENTGKLWTVYAYDENGNNTLRETYIRTMKSGIRRQDSVEYLAMTYDPINRLTKAQSEGMTAEYTYGVDNMRRSKTVNGTTQKFIWDGANIVAETDGQGTVTSQYYRGIGLIASKMGDLTSYYQTNDHGDVTAWGDVTYSYDAFGNEKTETAGTNNFRYSGEYQDLCSGLIYLRNRYYDPSIGRFISEDTHWNPNNMIYGDKEYRVGEIKIPNMNEIMQSSNLYAYCMNNPVKYVDPSGEVADWVILALYGYAQAVITSPDLQYDMQMLAYDISQGDYVSAAFDVVDILAPGISGSKMVPKFIRKYFDDVANWLGGVKTKNIEDLISAKSLTSNHSKGARWIPNNLKESLAMETVLSNPSGKTIVGRDLMKDSRWLGSDGWVKKAQNVNGVEIHYNYNELTGKFDDFKFK